MDKKNDKLVLDLSKPNKDFTEHLEISDNNRIIFSGKFGTGKTYFLNEYFKTKDNYDIIHLYPVNYSIASNEDILQLIKYDIGFELLKKDLEFEKTSFTKGFTSQFFIVKNITKIISSIIEHASKLGKPVFPYADTFVSLIKEAEKYKSDFENFHKEHQVDQKKEILDFLKSFTEKEGSLYEEDNITILIRELIGQLKLKEKETILIIDDLDRIDPEHIFRLLNVFSAHFDINRDDNKFGFNKIILVCDIENIRNIFNARYGTNVDFSGYIDKFYSTEVFKFNNIDIVLSNIFKIFDSMEVSPVDNKFLNLKSDYSKNYLELEYILRTMFRANAVNLRSLIKLNNKKYKVKQYSISIQGKNRYNVNFGILILFDFLKFILGSETALSTALGKCADFGIKDLDNNSSSYEKLRNIIPILDIEKNELNTGIVLYYATPFANKIEYKLNEISMSEGVYAEVIKVNGPDSYFMLLQTTYTKCIYMGLI